MFSYQIIAIVFHAINIHHESNEPVIYANAQIQRDLPPNYSLRPLAQPPKGALPHHHLHPHILKPAGALPLTKKKKKKKKKKMVKTMVGETSPEKMMDGIDGATWMAV